MVIILVKGIKMLDFTAVIVFAAMSCLIGYSVGVENGWHEVHKQEIVCQTMPDKEIYCYKNKSK